MKRKLLCVALVCTLVCSAQIASASLIGYYPLDEAVGATSVADTSGFGTASNLAVTNGTGTISTGQSGKLGNAVTFAPVSKNDTLKESSTLPTKYASLTNAVTVSCWVNAANTSGTVILTENRWGWVLAMIDGKPEMEVSADNEWAMAKADTAISTGTWYNVVGSYDGANVKLYMNGGSPTSAAQTGNMLTPGGTPLSVGNYYGTGYELSGSLDDVSVWNVALTDGKAISLSSGANVLGYGAGVMDKLFQVYDGTLASYTDGNMIWTQAADLSLGLGQASASAVQFDLAGGGVSASLVPEPSAIALAVMGLFGLLAYAWRKRK